MVERSERRQIILLFNELWFLKPTVAPLACVGFGLVLWFFFVRSNGNWTNDGRNLVEPLRSSVAFRVYNNKICPTPILDGSIYHLSAFVPVLRMHLSGVLNQMSVTRVYQH